MEGISAEEKRRLRAEKFGINVAEQQKQLEEQKKLQSKQQVFHQSNPRLNSDTRMIDDKAQGMTVEELEEEIARLQSRSQKFEGKLTEEAQKRLERLQRRLDFARHKEAPQPIQPESVISIDTLYLYGVDYMSTDDIKRYYQQFQTPEKGAESILVTWINDSSCRVQFESTQIAQRAYELCSLSSNTTQRTKLIIGEAMVDQESEGVDQRNFDLQIGWKESFGFQLKSRMQKLWMRFATDKDVKDESTKGQNSRYYNLQKQRRDQKLKALGLYKYESKGNKNNGPSNSSFIKKAIGKTERFQGNLREKLRANEGDDWISGINKNKDVQDQAEGDAVMDSVNDPEVLKSLQNDQIQGQQQNL